MAGLTRQIQVRHIVVEKEEVAALLKETIDSVETEKGRIKMLMSLAGKYSVCSTKEDGGNLGWVEMTMNPTDSRNPRGGYKPLENEELNDTIHQAVRDRLIHKGILFGPVKTDQGYHLVMITNEFTTDRIL